MRFVLCISCNGLGSKRTRLAVFPASMVPNESERPKKLAGFKVAARRASDGVKPASTSRANSSCRLVPGRSPSLREHCSSPCLRESRRGSAGLTEPVHEIPKRSHSTASAPSNGNSEWWGRAKYHSGQTDQAVRQVIAGHSQKVDVAERLRLRIQRAR